MQTKFINAIGNNRTPNLNASGGMLYTFEPFYASCPTTLADGLYYKTTAKKALIVPQNAGDPLPHNAPESVQGARIHAQAIFDLLPWASTKDVRYYINSVYLDCAGYMAATNGHIIQWRDSAECKALPESAIISREFIEFAKKMGAQLFIIGGGKVEFCADGGVYAQAALIDAKYPDVTRYMGLATSGIEYQFPDAAVVKDIVRKAKVLNKKWPVVNISGGNTGVISNGQFVPVVNSANPEISVAFNAEYYALAAGLGAPLMVKNATEAVYIRGDGFGAVIMPMRRV